MLNVTQTSPAAEDHKEKPEDDHERSTKHESEDDDVTSDDTILESKFDSKYERSDVTEVDANGKEQREKTMPQEIIEATVNHELTIEENTLVESEVFGEQPKAVGNLSFVIANMSDFSDSEVDLDTVEMPKLEPEENSRKESNLKLPLSSKPEQAAEPEMKNNMIKTESVEENDIVKSDLIEKQLKEFEELETSELKQTIDSEPSTSQANEKRETKEKGDPSEVLGDEKLEPELESSFSKLLQNTNNNLFTTKQEESENTTAELKNDTEQVSKLEKELREEAEVSIEGSTLAEAEVVVTKQKLENKLHEKTGIAQKEEANLKISEFTLMLDSTSKPVSNKEKLLSSKSESLANKKATLDTILQENAKLQQSELQSISNNEKEKIEMLSSTEEQIAAELKSEKTDNKKTETEVTKVEAKMEKYDHLTETQQLKIETKLENIEIKPIALKSEEVTKKLEHETKETELKPTKSENNGKAKKSNSNEKNIEETNEDDIEETNDTSQNLAKATFDFDVHQEFPNTEIGFEELAEAKERNVSSSSSSSKFTIIEVTDGSVIDGELPSIDGSLLKSIDDESFMTLPDQDLTSENMENSATDLMIENPSLQKLLVQENGSASVKDKVDFVDPSCETSLEDPPATGSPTKQSSDIEEPSYTPGDASSDVIEKTMDDICNTVAETAEEKAASSVETKLEIGPASHAETDNSHGETDNSHVEEKRHEQPRKESVEVSKKNAHKQVGCAKCVKTLVELENPASGFSCMK